MGEDKYSFFTMKIVLVPSFIFHHTKRNMSKSLPHMLKNATVFSITWRILFSSLLLRQNPGASLKYCESGGVGERLFFSFPRGMDITGCSLRRKG